MIVDDSLKAEGETDIQVLLYPTLQQCFKWSELLFFRDCIWSQEISENNIFNILTQVLLWDNSLSLCNIYCGIVAC